MVRAFTAIEHLLRLAQLRRRPVREPGRCARNARLALPSRAPHLGRDRTPMTALASSSIRFVGTERVPSKNASRRWSEPATSDVGAVDRRQGFRRRRLAPVRAANTSSEIGFRITLPVASPSGRNTSVRERDGLA